MRMLQDNENLLYRTPIAKIEINPDCRSPIVPVLRGLQHLYAVPDLRDRVLEMVMNDLVPEGVNPDRGREGMTCWQVTVLAAMRLGCNFTYDQLQDLAENHRTLCSMLQTGDWDDVSFSWHRIRDNLCRLRPETIEKMSHLIVEAGHRIDPAAAESIRGDCFVVETNIHYPTDSSLLLDGLKKILEIGAELAQTFGVEGWRQSKSLKKKAKRAARAAGRIQRAKGGNYQERLQNAYSKLFAIAELVLPRTQELLDYLFAASSPKFIEPRHKELMYWHDVTHHVLGVAQRRVMDGETVPNTDKIFSLFEPDTELIKRGKAKDPNQFGHSVFVVEDAIGFICDHTVVPLHTNDPDVMLGRIKNLQTRLGGKIKHGSFDRGFNSPENQQGLAEIIEHPCIPMTGPIQAKEQDKNASVEFRAAKQRHPGVESAIGALQSGNGLQRCRDRSSPGFKRYVALGILGRNLHTLGKLLLAAEYPKSEQAKTKRKSAA